MGGLSGWELIVVFVVVLLVFGPRKIPEVARGIGRVLGSARRLSSELQREMNLAELEDEPRRMDPGASRGGTPPGSTPPAGASHENAHSAPEAPEDTGSASGPEEPRIRPADSTEPRNR